MKNYETIHLQIENQVAWLTLKREPVNVLNIEMMQEIVDALEDLIANDSRSNGNYICANDWESGTDLLE